MLDFCLECGKLDGFECTKPMHIYGLWPIKPDLFQHIGNSIICRLFRVSQGLDWCILGYSKTCAHLWTKVVVKQQGVGRSSPGVCITDSPDGDAHAG